ncbi:MAG: site-2 protease family protein [Planctomycetota bacterium]
MAGTCAWLASTSAIRANPPPPDSLHAKNVPQRFLIYSGGVIMNVIFALVCFPLVYHFGVPAVRPVVGATIPGMPAWEARIPRGTEILSIEGREVHDFMGIPSEVAISGSKPVHMHVRYPGEADTRDIALTPRKDEHNGFYRVGMGPASDPHWTLEVDPDGPAAAAGLLSGDRVRSVRGSLPGQDPESALIQAYAANAPVTLEVERNESLIDVTVEPLWKPVEGRAVFGIEPPSHRIEAVRTAGPAQHLGLQAGDRLVSIAGKPVWRSTDLLLGLIDALPAPCTPRCAAMARPWNSSGPITNPPRRMPCTTTWRSPRTSTPPCCSCAPAAQPKRRVCRRATR